MARLIRIECQGLEYICPTTPAKVRGDHLPKKDQVWYRREEYKKFDWELPQGKWTPEQSQWFDEEIARLHTGDWIMMNGSPTWFNKYCYFFHQWFVLLEKVYPDYKETSLEYFRFYELCENDPFTLGDCGIKGRRVGLSSMSASIKVLIGLIEDNALEGVVSKTGDDAYESYLMVKNGIENLEPFLMPELNKVTESEIHIAKPSKKISVNNTKATGDKGKNNRINWLDTSESAYDGRRMRHVTIDEAGKWQKYNVKTCLSGISDALVTGAYVVGHVSVFTTVNKGDKGGDNFREIWDGSDHINGKIDQYGRTKTKLKRFFLPAFRGYLGYVGKYGESIIENPTREQIEYLKTHQFWNPVTKRIEKCPDPKIGAKQWLQTTRDMLADDPEGLADEMRKNPFEWKEVFKGANNKCNFDLEELNAQIEAIEAELGGKKEMGRRMRFAKASNGDKVPEDHKEGMWFTFELIENNNRSIYKNNIKCPNNSIYGAAGLDPFAHAKQALEDGSDACILVMKRYDALDPENSYMPVAMFLGRPKTKADFFNQLYWGLEYYGIKVLGERAPTDWIDYATNKAIRLASDEDLPKKEGYLIVTKRSNGSEVFGINPQDKEAREQHLTEMVEYAMNNMKKIRFIRLLRDMVKFDINERTKYDACMAFGYALMALKEWKLVEKVVTTRRVFMQAKRSKVYR